MPGLQHGTKVHFRWGSGGGRALSLLVDVLETQLALPPSWSQLTTKMGLKRFLDAQRPIGNVVSQDLEAVHDEATSSLDQQLQPEGVSGVHGLTGAAHKRFVIATSLLYLIDPVRGEPTVHSLDRHPHDNNGRLENHQKKFLDSFALICSTSRIGAETASAVCLEQGQ